MKNILTVIAVLILSVSLAQTTLNKSIPHSTGMRDYIIYIPAMYDGTEPVPLLLNLHGYGSNNQQQIAYGEFRPIADTANFIMVVPQGLQDPINNTTHWNANFGSGIDDIDFISTLIDTVSNNYNINSSRVYSTGMSNGGFMSYTLAGQLSSKITAVASVTGSMVITQPNANTVSMPMPIMQIHGTADATVPYNGDNTFLSIDSVVGYWVAHNNCNNTPTVTNIPDTNPNDGCTATLYEYTGGTNGAEVVLYKITDGGHTWPDAIVTIGVTNRDFNASEVIWEFFSQYDKINLLSAASEQTQDWVKLNSANPITNSTLSLAIDNKANTTVYVFNQEGKVISSIFNQSGDISLNTEAWSRGLYFLQILQGNKAAVIKVVK